MVTDKLFILNSHNHLHITYEFIHNIIIYNTWFQLLYLNLIFRK